MSKSQYKDEDYDKAPYKEIAAEQREGRDVRGKLMALLASIYARPKFIARRMNAHGIHKPGDTSGQKWHWTDAMELRARAQYEADANAFRRAMGTPPRGPFVQPTPEELDARAKELDTQAEERMKASEERERAVDDAADCTEDPAFRVNERGHWERVR